MLAAPQDGRIFFVIPWKGGSLIGTTDTAYRRPADDVRPGPADVKYLIAAVNETLPEARIQRSEIIAAQAGLRPLVAPERRGDPSSISRDYRLDTGPDGLIVVEGGKYTIFRKLAERVVDEVIEDIVAKEPARSFSPCVTDTRILPGAATSWPAFREKEIERLTSRRLSRDAAARLVGRYGARAKEVVAAAGRESWLLNPACDGTGGADASARRDPDDSGRRSDDGTRSRPVHSNAPIR